MVYIILGSAAFVLVLFSDFVRLRRMGFLRSLIWVVCAPIAAYSVVMIAISGSTFDLPRALSLLGWFLLAISIGLIVYSAFLELPPKEASYALVTTGTWALVRHPPILWLALLLIGLVFITQSYLLLIAAPIWWGTNLLYVWLEERFLLSKTFPSDYEDYKKTTPMLIPTKRSLQRCLQTLKASQHR